MALSIVIALTAIAAPAQLVESNDAGGSLTSAGFDPTPGTPFVRGVATGIDITVGGNPDMPYILAMGSYAPSGVIFPALGNQVVNLFLPGGVIILGDPFGGTGVLPIDFFYLATDGTSSWRFPIGPGSIGTNMAFQAITLDVAMPFGFNVTAAADFHLVTAPPFTVNLLFQLPNLDDGLGKHDFVGGPYCIYGQPMTGVGVSTNGYITFAPTAVASTFVETSAEFITGTPSAGPAAPMIAVMWEDLHLGGPGASMTLTEDPIQEEVTVSWTGNYFNGAAGGPGAPFGTISCRITFGSTPAIVLDYSGFTGFGPAEGIVGVSDGNIGSGNDNEVDLVLGGVPVGYGDIADFSTTFQNFEGLTAVPAEPFDLGGLLLNYLDTSPTGRGNWVVF